MSPRPLALLAGTLALGVALARPAPPRALADCECDPRPLEAVFVIDSTGSMSGALESVKRRVQRVLELLRENAPSVRVGIVTYRDVGDEYLRKGLELTDNFPRVVEYLKGITANGGGDTPEAIEAGLELAYSKESMRWSERAKKVAVLIADAPCHDDKKQLCLDLAKRGHEQGVVLFTISVDGNVAGFKELAAQGGGKNVDIASTDDIARTVLAFALDRDPSEFASALGETAPHAARAHAGFRPADGNGAAFVLAQLQHEGDWDPPHHSARLLRALRERAGLEVVAERRVVRALDDKLLDEPLVYVTGHGELHLAPEEEARLRGYVERGGTVLLERCCDGAAFDASARALGRRLAGRELVPVPATHPVYRAGSEIASLEHAVEHGSGTYAPRRPELLVAEDDRGRPLVVYSPLDLGCGWSGVEGGKSCALRESDALKWTINVLLWLVAT